KLTTNDLDWRTDDAAHHVKRLPRCDSDSLAEWRLLDLCTGAITKIQSKRRIVGQLDNGYTHCALVGRWIRARYDLVSLLLVVAFVSQHDGLPGMFVDVAFQALDRGDIPGIGFQDDVATFQEL